MVEEKSIAEVNFLIRDDSGQVVDLGSKYIPRHSYGQLQPQIDVLE